MKKLRLFFRNLPRKTKIAGNIVLCLLLAFWIYLLVGSPADITALYRRAERANLVGPGNILTILENPGMGYEELVLAEEGNYVIVYVRDKDDRNRTQLVYRERSQGMALLSLPSGGWNQDAFREIPIFLFDGYSNARRAELFLCLPDGTQGAPLLSAQREQDCYFRFTLTDKNGMQQELIRRLLLLSENTAADPRDHSLQAQVRLYDGMDSLLTECTLILGE